MTLLSCNDLKVTYEAGPRDIHAVNGIGLELEQGESHGLVGESGCGKTTVAETVLNLLPENASVETGSIDFDGVDLLGLTPKQMRRIRWERISYIPQSAMDSLDPVMPTGDQIVQSIRKHRDVSKRVARERVREVFELVGLDPERIDNYPHQFSGGMRQRVTIAMAIALEPDLIIADEPTTGLDVIVQHRILDKIREIQEKTDSTLLLITHDMGVVAETCDRVSVMYGGMIVEQGTTVDVFTEMANPYTMGLKNAFPDLGVVENESISIPGSPPEFTEHPSQCVFIDRCPFAEEACREGHPDLVAVEGDDDHRSACYFIDEAEEFRQRASRLETWEGSDPAVFDRARGGRTGETIVETRDVTKWFPTNQSIVDRMLGRAPDYIKAVNGVSIKVRESEVVGLAGESGCGKSTLALLLTGLEPITDGSIYLNGVDLTDEIRENPKEFRKNVQIIFQDPFDSLNPRNTVRQIVGEPLKIHGLHRENRVEVISDELDEVGLSPAARYLDKYPHQLSGGERQRVAIARALVLDPDLLVCDEPASMLDVSLKASLLNLLRRLANDREMGMIYISHDIPSLVYVADRMEIMYLGGIVERGTVREVVSAPSHPYTHALMSANPDIDPRAESGWDGLAGEPGDPIDLPSGCNFAPRCPNAEEKCFDVDPAFTAAASGEDHEKRCHYPVDAAVMGDEPDGSDYAEAD
ncbi:MAG: ABC transporter ATP-binding protein [Halobacteriales archaeon]|nr:ABC transporter ATP-binding protein [Halobacteriales archaeon]